MSSLFSDGGVLASLGLIIILPTLIILAGEWQERLRQRGSMLEQPVATVRNLMLPLVALWALAVFVLDIDQTSIGVRLLGTAIVLAAVGAVLQVLRRLIALISERSSLPGRRGIPQLLLLLPRLGVLILAFFVVFRVVWSVDLSGLFAALGVTSLVISVALQDTLSGLASGFLLLGDRPFSPGDWIQVGDIEGVVIDINWRSSRIRDRSGDLLVIPNANVAGAAVVNYTEPTPLHRVVVPVQVAYANSPSRAVDMLLAAARATPDVLEDPAPLVRVVQIDDPLMGYEIHLWIDDYSIAPRVFSDCGSLVWYMSHRMDVPLPSPAFDLYHHDPIQEAADAEVTPAEVFQRLAAAPLLAELGEADLLELAGAATPFHYRQGEVILEPGTVNRDLLVLWRGHARMSVADLPGRNVELSPGDVFGLLSRFRSVGTQPTVGAVSDCELVVIEGEAAAAVTSRNPSLAAALNQLMETRRRRFEPSVAVDGATRRRPEVREGDR